MRHQIHVVKCLLYSQFLGWLLIWDTEMHMLCFHSHSPSTCLLSNLSCPQFPVLLPRPWHAKSFFTIQDMTSSYYSVHLKWRIRCNAYSSANWMIYPSTLSFRAIPTEAALWWQFIYSYHQYLMCWHIVHYLPLADHRSPHTPGGTSLQQWSMA